MNCPNCGKKNIKKAYKVGLLGEEKIYCDKCVGKKGVNKHG